MDEDKKDIDNTKNVADNNENVKFKTRKKKDYSKYYNNSMQEKLSIAFRTLEFLKISEDLRKLMESVGYDKDKITLLIEVVETASDAVNNQHLLQAEMHEAYRLFLIDFTSAQLELRYLLKVVKVALRDDLQKMEILQINTKRGKSKADYFTFMDSFYNQLLADAEILDKLAIYGYPKDRVISCFKIVLAAKTGYGIYIKAKAVSTEATRIQKQKIAEIDKWMSEYNTLSKVAEAQKLLATNQA